MDWLTVEGVPPWDGRYELDLDGRPLTNLEWRWIRQLSGYMPMTIDEGLNGGDPGVFTVFAVIALHRAGRIEPAQASQIHEQFDNAPAGTSVTLEIGEQEGEESLPPPASSSSRTNGSGDSSKTSSETPAKIPPATGSPPSATSGSPPTVLATSPPRT